MIFSGQHLNDGEKQNYNEEISFYRQHIQTLEVQYKKVEQEKSKVKTKLLKKLRIDMSAVRRKLRNLGVDITEDKTDGDCDVPGATVLATITNSNSADSGRETESEAIDTNGHGGPVHLNGSNMSPSSSSGIGIADDTNGVAPPVNGTNGSGHSSDSEPSNKKSPTKTDYENGPKIEENGNLPNGSEHSDREERLPSDPTLLPTNDRSSLKDNDEKYVKRKKQKQVQDDTNGSSHDDLQNFQPLDLVWAKCKGYPWYPALIMNPELATQEPLLHGDEELPQPAPDVIEMGNRYNCKEDGEVHHLVLFFDQRRTW